MIVGAACCGMFCLFIAIIGGVILGLSFTGHASVGNFEAEFDRFNDADVNTGQCFLRANPRTPNCKEQDVCVETYEVYKRGEQCAEYEPGYTCWCEVTVSRLDANFAENISAQVWIGETADKDRNLQQWCDEALSDGSGWYDIMIGGQTKTECKSTEVDSAPGHFDTLTYLLAPPQGPYTPNCMVDLRPGSQVDCVKMPQDGRIMLGSRDMYVTELSAAIEQSKSSGSGARIAGIVLLSLPGLIIVLICSFFLVVWVVPLLCACCDSCTRPRRAARVSPLARKIEKYAQDAQLCEQQIPGHGPGPSSPRSPSTPSSLRDPS